MSISVTQRLLHSESVPVRSFSACHSDDPTSGEVKVSSIRIGPSGLPIDLVESWRGIQNSNPNLASPYFSPEFTLAAAESRDDTEVSLAFRGNTPVAFFPFHRISKQSAIPVGGAINDYHGVIAPGNMKGCLQQLVDGAGLKQFDFHSLWTPREEAAPWSVDDRIMESSAVISGAGEDYLEQLPRNSRTIWKQSQKTRKMIRELGPLRFEMHDPDPARLEWLIDLKRDKYRRTGCTDFFKPEWSRTLLKRLNSIQSPDFRGIMSVLYAGDQAVAGHFGIATKTVLHYWYPVFENRFAIYSPGTEFWLQLVRQAISEGFQRVDFGYGEEAFKTKLANRQGVLACGCVGAGKWQWRKRKLLYGMHQRIKRSRFRTLIRDSVRTIWPSAGKPRVR